MIIKNIDFIVIILLLYSMTTKITVCNISVAALRARGINNFEEWSKLDNSLYIGRNACYVKGATQSKWHNPYTVKKYGLERSLELYYDHIKSDDNLYNSLDELEGKELGCWCKPNKCHGDILKKLYKEKKKRDKRLYRS